MKDYSFVIEKNFRHGCGFFEMELRTAETLPEIIGGQFLQLELPGRPDMPLRRPFCIYKYTAHTVTIIYAVVGGGSQYMTELKKGTTLRALLPLGNGFVLSDKHKNVVLLGGGTGAAPLLPVARSYPDKEFSAFLGFPSKAQADVFADDYRKEIPNACITTDDGSCGLHCFPTEALEKEMKNGYRPDVILACGPEAMVKAALRLAETCGADAFMTGENRMACGMGGCLVCTCAVRGEDGTVSNLRSCMEGPVFEIKKLVF